MLMSDTKIKGLIRSGVLMDASESNVGPVSYDLTTKCFYADGKELDETTLNPGESVFVGSVETVSLPSDVAARIQLKNSRIRQGLSLDAPLYFPGHSTRLFFRVTNVSADAIVLDAARGIAQVTFETVDGVEVPYEGAFSKEFDFKGLASYEGVYSDQIKKIEKKKGEVEGIEKRIYGNVLALFAIFAAIFTLVNVNAGAVSNGPTAFNVVVVDLMVVGGFTLLAAVIDSIISGNAGSKPKWWLYVIAGIALVASAFLAVRLNGGCA